MVARDTYVSSFRRLPRVPRCAREQGGEGVEGACGSEGDHGLLQEREGYRDLSYGDVCAVVVEAVRRRSIQDFM